MLRVVSVMLLMLLSGCNDRMVSWESEDVIQTKQFALYFQACAEAQASLDRMDGFTFHNCLISSYNLAKEK